MQTPWPQRRDIERLPFVTPIGALRLDRLQAIVRDEAARHADHHLAWRPTLLEFPGDEATLAILEVGAVGFSCSRIDVAESVCRAGANSVTLMRMPAWENGVARLAQLAHRAEVTVICDHFAQAEAVSTACRKADASIKLLINIDVGPTRLGVRPGPDLDVLLRGLHALPHVRFTGISLENGGSPSVGVSRLDQSGVENVLQGCLKTLTRAGITQPSLSLGELGDYGNLDFGLRDARSPLPCTEDSAIAVIAGVIARPTRELAVIDAGFLEVGSGPHRLFLPGRNDANGDLGIVHLAEDHAVLSLVDDAQDLLIGDVVAILGGAGRSMAWARSILVREHSCWRLARTGQ